MRRSWSKKNTECLSKSQLMKILVPESEKLIEEFRSQVQRRTQEEISGGKNAADEYAEYASLAAELRA